MNTEKIDAALLGVLEEWDENGQDAILQFADVIGVSASDDAATASATVFLHCEPGADLSALSALGVVLDGEARSDRAVRTAQVPLTALEGVAAQPAVLRVVASRYLHPTLDDACAQTAVAAFASRERLAGRNVVVGVVDSGIDADHAALKGRVLRLWDQTIAGAGIPEAPYGEEYSPMVANVGLDHSGHGTHVASIACGQDQAYPGVAPEAELVIVKTTRQEAHLADAVRYVFRVASELQRPAVVNLSLSGHHDAHDGSDSLSQVIDAESGAGRIVCCAAGNSGAQDIHGHLELAPGDTAELSVDVHSVQAGRVEVHGWVDDGATLEVSVAAPSGAATPFRGPAAGAPDRTMHGLDASRVDVTVLGAPAPNNGDHSIDVLLRGGAVGQPVAQGTWRICLRNGSAETVRFDAWLCSPAHQAAFVKGVQAGMKIGAPGAAESAVTVAAYTTKTNWTDAQGQPQADPSLVLGGVAPFSSDGPLRGGILKPDVAAPGAAIVAALSRHSNLPGDRRVSTKHAAMQGTSMAAPFVSGLIALLLERDPTADPVKIKALLKNASRIPALQSGTWDPKWGYGLVKADKL